MDRVGHPNDTLFFWAFEKENGSLTAGANERSTEPWGIWLNGGSENNLAAAESVVDFFSSLFLIFLDLEHQVC